MPGDNLHMSRSGNGRNIVALPENCLALCNGLQGYIFVLDLRGTILCVNREVEETLAYPPAQILGTSILNLHPPERRGAAMTAIQNVTEEKPVEFCIPIVDGHGRRIPVESSVYRVRFMEREVLFAVCKDQARIDNARRLFDVLYGLSPLPMAFLDINDYRIIGTNQSFLAMTGLGEADVTGVSRRGPECIGDAGEMNDLCLRAKSAGYATSPQVTLPPRNGHNRHGIVHAWTVNADSRACLLVAVIEATESTRAKKDPEGEALKNAGIINAMADLFFSFDENLLCRSAGGADLPLFTNPGSCIGRQARSIFSRYSERKIVQALKAARSTGKTQTAAVRMRMNNNAPGYYEIVVLADENKGGTLIARNVAARRAMETKVRSLRDDLVKREKDARDDLDQVSRKLNLKEHQLRAILDNISDLAWVKDCSGKYLVVNEPFARTCRLTDPEGLAGKTDFDVWPHHLALLYVNDDREVMKKRKSLQRIERMADPGVKNEYRWVQTLKNPVYDAEGQLIGTVGTARDITERKQWVENVERYNERLRSLAAYMMDTEEIQLNMISRTLHDYIGQNLNTAVLNLNMVQMYFNESPRSFERARLEESVSLIADSISQIRDLTSDIRSPVIDDHGLASAIKQLCLRWEQRSGLRFITRGKDISPRPPRNIENGLYRIADEAINNVVKHARALTVTIDLHRRNDSVLLTVADDGIGFDWRAHVERNDPKKWGLIIMRERVLEMNGQFRVTSRETTGTKIRVEIPYEH